MFKSLLSPQEKREISRLLQEDVSHIHLFAPLRLYISVANPEILNKLQLNPRIQEKFKEKFKAAEQTHEPFWIPFAKGMLTMCMDPNSGIFSFKMVSPDMKRIVFEHEIYQNCVLLQLASNFVAFEGQYGMVGFCFPEGYDVEFLIEKYNKVKSIWENPMKAAKKEQNLDELSKSAFSPFPSTSTSFYTNTPAFASASTFDSQSPEKKTEKTEKVEKPVGAPIRQTSLAEQNQQKNKKASFQLRKTAATLHSHPHFHQKSEASKNRKKSGTKEEITSNDDEEIEKREGVKNETEKSEKNKKKLEKTEKPKKIGKKSSNFFKKLIFGKKKKQNKEEESQPKKPKIGNPKDFAQVGHIGIEESFGVPEELWKVFKLAKVNKEDLADPKTFEFLKQTVEETTGTKWSEVLKQKSPPPPKPQFQQEKIQQMQILPPATLEQQERIEENEENEEKKKEFKLPPPPVPQRSKRGTLTSSSVAAPSRVPSGPPPKPVTIQPDKQSSPIHPIKKLSPPPPPSKLLPQRKLEIETTNSDAAENVVTAANPVGIPMPPPPPPLTTPKKPKSTIEPASPSKSVSTAPYPAEQKMDLLEEIRQGTKLRPVSSAPLTELPPVLSPEQESLAKILEIAMEKRRRQMKLKEGEDEEEEEEEDEGEEAENPNVRKEGSSSDWDD